MKTREKREEQEALNDQNNNSDLIDLKVVTTDVYIQV